MDDKMTCNPQDRMFYRMALALKVDEQKKPKVVKVVQ